MMDKWDNRIYKVAEEVAGWSKDPDEGVGAVLVSPDRRQVSWGFNGLPRNVADTDERLNDKDTKNRLTLHAEMNALLNSVVDVTGWTMYCTKFPCLEKCCAQAIIQRGIARVVCPHIRGDSRWVEDQTGALSLLREVGIKVETFIP